MELIQTYQHPHYQPLPRLYSPAYQQRLFGAHHSYSPASPSYSPTSLPPPPLPPAQQQVLRQHLINRREEEADPHPVLVPALHGKTAATSPPFTDALAGPQKQATILTWRGPGEAWERPGEAWGGPGEA